MKEQIIAQRYAQAFMAYAKDKVGLPQVFAEFKMMKVILVQNPEFPDFLGNPQISYRDKYLVIDEVFKDFSQEVRTFLKLLIEKGRSGIIIGIIDYIRINYDPKERIEALLKTSYPLDADLIKRIKEKLEHKFRKKLKLYLELDAGLLGGIQVVVGNTIIDGSVRKRLDDLRQRLMKVQVS